LVGGGLGMLIAYWTLGLADALMPQSLPRIHEMRIDGRVLSFTIVLSAAAGVLCGLLPALRFRSQEISSALNQGGIRTTESAGGRRLRSLLAGLEIALSLMLVIGAGLLVKSFVRLHRTDPGFDANHVVTAMLALLPAKYPEAPQVTNFYGEFLERVKAIPDVR